MIGRIQLHFGRIIPLIAISILAVLVACGSSATATSKPEPTATAVPQPTATAPSSGGAPTATPYAYAARSIIEELDAKYPWPPKIPPWPPRRGG